MINLEENDNNNNTITIVMQTCRFQDKSMTTFEGVAFDVVRAESESTIIIINY